MEDKHMEQNGMVTHCRGASQALVNEWHTTGALCHWVTRALALKCCGTAAQEADNAKRRAALAADKRPAPCAENVLDELVTPPLVAKRRSAPAVSLGACMQVPKEQSVQLAPQRPLQGPLAGAVVQQRRRLYSREHEPRRAIFSR